MKSSVRSAVINRCAACGGGAWAGFFNLRYLDCINAHRTRQTGGDTAFDCRLQRSKISIIECVFPIEVNGDPNANTVHTLIARRLRRAHYARGDEIESAPIGGKCCFLETPWFIITRATGLPVCLVQQNFRTSEIHSAILAAGAVPERFIHQKRCCKDACVLQRTLVDVLALTVST